MAWTKEQQAAIDSRGQTLLLSAAAGSGKTAVLVERIIQRLLDKDNPIDITEMLVVTFTKAAAAEMRERIAGTLSQKLAEGQNPELEKQLALLPSAHISTLHAFCQAVIRRYFYTIDIDPQFMVAAEEEMGLLRRSVLEELLLSYYEDDQKSAILYPLSDMFSNDRGDDELMGVIGKMYDYSRSMPWPEAWLEKAVTYYDVPAGAKFDDLCWCEAIKRRVRNIVAEQKAVYDNAIQTIDSWPALQAGAENFYIEQQQLSVVLKAESWADLQQAMSAIAFDRLGGLKKLDDDVKTVWDGLKHSRDEVKKIIKDLQGRYFSSKPEEWIADMKAMQPVISGLVQLTKDFAEAFRLAKKEKGWVDFSDLEHYCLQILMDPASEPGKPIRSVAAEELCQSFQEVLIDEYQDTNGVQELITHLVSHENNRFMVGDIKQSIYRFRLADPTLFLEKYNQFSRDPEATERCIDLGKNFRSAGNILEAVNEVFARAMTKESANMDYGEHEKLYMGRAACEEANWVGGPIEIHLLDGIGPDSGTADDENNSSENEEELTAFEQECAMAAQRLVELKEQGFLVQQKDGSMEPLAWHHIVVLMRSLEKKADAMLKALQMAGIPAFAEQGGGYFGAIEVEIMMALLRCIDNPEQDLAMTAVLRSPIVGIGEASLAKLRLSGTGTLWDLLPQYTENLADGDEKDRLTDFCHSLETWRTFSRRNGVAELLQRIYDDTSYLEYVSGMPNGAVRQANLQALYQRARQYENVGYRGLFRYLQFLDKVKNNKTDLSPATVLGESEDVVRVMTIHKSKGLEFPVVVIADTGKGFNMKDTQASILYHQEDGIGLKFYDASWRLFYPTLIWSGISARLEWESIAEEERILYVAMTRAKDKLILTGHVADLTKQWVRWQGGVVPARAKNYLDWVMPVLADQDDNGPLTELVWKHADGNGEIGLWQLYLHHSVGSPAMTETETVKDPRLALLRSGNPTETAVPDWLPEQLSWQYGYPQAVHTPAKFSVSEIKQQFGLLHMAELAEDTAMAAGTVAIDREDAFSQSPQWLAGAEEAVTGAQRGTVVHKVMQYIDVAAVAAEQDIKNQLAAWESEGLFTAAETKLVYPPVILDFCQSSLGKRMAASGILRREYPFSALFPGGGYLPVVETTERMLVQGVIDCMFREENGWVIIDYKTDHLGDEEAFRTRYAVQLALYKQAMEQITGEPVTAMYIYSFHLNKEIAF